VPGKRLLPALLLLLVCAPLQAWTGISAFIGEYDSDWRIGNEVRPLTLTRYGIAIEDRASSGLRVGVSIGEFGLRLKNSAATESDDYAGEYLDLRLRWPLQISRMLTLHGDFGYGWHAGRLSDSGDGSIDWSRARVGMGLQFQMGLLGLRPFIEWRSVDGDVDLGGSRRLFENDAHTRGGLIVDLKVDPSGFVRFTWITEGQSGLMLSFVRAY